MEPELIDILSWIILVWGVREAFKGTFGGRQ